MFLTNVNNVDKVLDYDLVHNTMIKNPYINVKTTFVTGGVAMGGVERLSETPSGGVEKLSNTPHRHLPRTYSTD